MVAQATFFVHFQGPYAVLCGSRTIHVEALQTLIGLFEMYTFHLFLHQQAKKLSRGWIIYWKHFDIPIVRDKLAIISCQQSGIADAYVRFILSTWQKRVKEALVMHYTRHQCCEKWFTTFKCKVAVTFSRQFSWCTTKKRFTSVSPQSVRDHNIQQKKKSISSNKLLFWLHRASSLQAVFGFLLPSCVSNPPATCVTL